MKRKHKWMSFLARFMRANKGATALIWGISALPLLAFAGGIVDYGKALRVKSEINATLDTAVLAATQAYALDKDADTTAVVQNYIDENYLKSGKNLLTADVTVNDVSVGENEELTAVIDVKVENHFLTLVGFPAFDFSLSSSGRVGGRSLEVVLVLDNTGSMEGGKLQSLKDSANILVDKLMIDGMDNMRMALVPFSEYVNIGMDYRDESGLDIPADYSVHKEGSWTSWDCPNPDVNQHCTDNPGTCYNVEGQEISCGRTCTCDVPKVKNTHYYNYDQSYEWNGCMVSRPHDLNVQDSSYATGVPGLMETWNRCESVVTKLTPLTSTKSDISDALELMQANGRTYIPGGLAWGWRVLSNEAPFSDAAPYTEGNVTKVIVLMTDGANTLKMRKWNNNKTINHAGEVWAHDMDWDNPEIQSNQYTEELCTNIKDKGIVIHTIGFGGEISGDIETLMKNCAGNGGQYHDADDSEELANAFNRIALALLNLRLSK